MILSSSVFKDGESISNKYTCDGENISPPLSIGEIPKNAKSLALIVDDPDAVPFAGHVFVHWLVINISHDTSEIKEGTKPQNSIEGTTSYNKSGWGRPCPPAGNHRYYFKLYALDTLLNVNESATKQDILSAMEGHILEQCQLVGMYQRTK